MALSFLVCIDLEERILGINQDKFQHLNGHCTVHKIHFFRRDEVSQFTRINSVYSKRY